MSQRNKNNSIIFLTTLSVYLGLVLVGGAASPVLAQAALTRNFDVQDEIEVKDDLDKNPNDAGNAEKFFEIDLENALIQFVNDLRQLNRLGKYQWKSKRLASTECWHSFCSEIIGGASRLPGSESWVSPTLDKLHKKLDITGERSFQNSLGFIEFPNAQKEEDACKEFGLKFEFGKSEFKTEITFSQASPQKADAFAAYINNAFSVRAENSKEVLSKLIYGNTKAKVKNHYVLVITRLPRGSLDKLVKQDTKANM